MYADEHQRLSCMSIGFLLTNKNDSVVWRGPKKNGKKKRRSGWIVGHLDD